MLLENGIIFVEFIVSTYIAIGAATIRLEMPSHMQNSLIFHYNLKFYGNDTDNYDGVSLKRFVMQVRKYHIYLQYFRFATISVM